MNPQRISLDSPMLAGRIKKFDTYQQRGRTNERTPSIAKSEVPRAQQVSLNINVAGQSKHSQPQTTQRIARTSEISLERPSSSIQPVTQTTQSRTIQIALQAVAHAPAGFDVQFDGAQPIATKKRKMTRFQIAFYGFGIAMFLFAGGVSVQTLLTNKEAKEQINVLGATQVADEQGVVEGTGSDPAEAEVPAQAVANYRVNPELPRYLRITELGIFARIKHTGVNKDGAVDSPANINDVSWFNESAQPGNAVGSSLLLGHVSGWSAPGVFKKIDKLKAGMRFEVEKGSGEKLTYEVTRGEKIPVDQVDMSKILGVEVAGEHDLKLMTCSGKYNRETKQYEDRYIVYAKILR